jgi:hypothetical protein
MQRVAQDAGRPWDEPTLYRVARAFEQAGEPLPGPGAAREEIVSASAKARAREAGREPRRHP